MYTIAYGGQTLKKCLHNDFKSMLNLKNTLVTCEHIIGIEAKKAISIEA